VRALGARIHSYPAEQRVPDQDASCEANRLKAAGPIFGDGSKPRRAPVTRLPRSPSVPAIGPADEPRPSSCLHVRALWNQTRGEIPPQGDQQLARQCNRRDLADATAPCADALDEPAGETANRAAWCPRSGSRVLFGTLISAFTLRGPVIMALDDTIARCRGKRIAAKGIYRDPVRSSDSHSVKASGLRWMSLMLLAPVPQGRTDLGLAVPHRPRPFRARLLGARAGISRCSTSVANSPLFASGVATHSRRPT
jgi:hypothetical protein